MAGTLNRNGRKPGSKNKHTTAIREAFVAAFEELGGVEALVEWGRANQTDFYKLASKLIPTEITGAGGDPLAPPVIHVVAPAG